MTRRLVEDVKVSWSLAGERVTVEVEAADRTLVMSPEVATELEKALGLHLAQVHRLHEHRATRPAPG